MGDNIANREKENLTGTESVSGSSLKQLRSVKPSENIAILDISSEETVQKVHDELDNVEDKVETFFEKPLEASDSENKKMEEENLETKQEAEQPEAEPKPNDTEAKAREGLSKDKLPTTNSEKTTAGSVASGLITTERVIRNQSDIFSLKDEPSSASAIFSINGSPSRKVFRRKEVTVSNVFPFGQATKEDPPSEKIVPAKEKVKDVKECYNELIRPSGSARNPLTGSGLSSNDEYKFKGTKRKDGNPLLGLGYSPEVTPSTHRIPPGGFSHKLW